MSNSSDLAHLEQLSLISSAATIQPIINLTSGGLQRSLSDLNDKINVLSQQYCLTFETIGVRTFKAAAKELSHNQLIQFLIFWAFYPRKQALRHAARAFKKAEIDADTFNEILTTLSAQERYCEKLVSDGKNPPWAAHPATWINQERWTDSFEDNRVMFTERAVANQEQQLNEMDDFFAQLERARRANLQTTAEGV